MIREEMKYLHPSKKLKYMQRMGVKFFDNRMGVKLNYAKLGR